MTTPAALPDKITADSKLDLFESLVASTSNGVVITDADSNILYVNPAFTAITGYRAELVLGANMRILHSSRQGTSFYQAMWKSLLRQGNWEGALWNRRKSGEVYQEWLSISAIKSGGEETGLFVGVFSDISSIKSKEHILENLAFCDPLTQLPNKLLFLDRLEHCIRFARRTSNEFAVMYLDLDAFRKLNETHGFSTGDRVLMHVADRLEASLREVDTIARMGGDEFAVILWKTPASKNVTGIVDRVMRAIAEPLKGDDRLIHVSSSVGIGHYPQDGQDGKLLLYYTMFAMYRAKELGGGRCQSFESLHDRIETHG